MNTIKIKNKKYLEIKGRLPREFSKAVAILERPYIKIDSSEYNTIIENTKSDFLYSHGIVYTFGGADGGRALMPVNTTKRKYLINKNIDQIEIFENRQKQA